MPLHELRRETRLDRGVVANPGRLFETCKDHFAWNHSIIDRPFARFGVPYADDKDREIIPFDKALGPLRVEIEQRCGFLPNSCSCHWYLGEGSFMGSHSDDLDAIAENTGVVIISLGGERSLRFKWKRDPDVVCDFRLTNGSLFFMSRKLQINWRHEIAKQGKADPRISLVFRKIPLVGKDVGIPSRYGSD